MYSPPVEPPQQLPAEPQPATAAAGSGEEPIGSSDNEATAMLSASEPQPAGADCGLAQATATPKAEPAAQACPAQASHQAGSDSGVARACPNGRVRSPASGNKFCGAPLRRSSLLWQGRVGRAAEEAMAGSEDKDSFPAGPVLLLAGGA